MSSRDRRYKCSRGRDNRDVRTRIEKFLVQRSEWTRFVVGSVALRMSIAFLLVFVAVLTLRAWRQSDGPPDVAITVVDIAREPPGYRVGVVAKNGGGHPAERVLVRGELRRGAMTETADTRISFIPAASWCWAGVHFRHDPRGPA